MTGNKTCLILSTWILSLSLSAMAAAPNEACSGAFDPVPREGFKTFQVDGVKPTAFQALRNKLSFQKSSISGFEARTRYLSHFHEIFADAHPAPLSRVRTHFKWYPTGQYGGILSSGHMGINKKLKNHPLYPLVHAHELSHLYDIEIGQLPPSLLTPHELLDSEIRAHHRQWVAARKIFTKEELQSLRDAEKDEFLQGLLEGILQYGDRPEDYVTISLMASYKSLLVEASGSSVKHHQELYLRQRIHSILKARL